MTSRAPGPYKGGVFPVTARECPSERRPIACQSERTATMMFQDFILDSRLAQHRAEELTHELDEAAQRSKQLLARFLSKERIIEETKINQDPSKTHFFHEFPRKQSNNDLQYHNDDVVINFLVKYFFLDDKKKDK